MNVMVYYDDIKEDLIGGVIQATLRYLAVSCFCHTAQLLSLITQLSVTHGSSQRCTFFANWLQPFAIFLVVSDIQIGQFLQCCFTF